MAWKGDTDQIIGRKVFGARFSANSRTARMLDRNPQMVADFMMPKADRR
jgi:hypothetical protein